MPPCAVGKRSDAKALGSMRVTLGDQVAKELRFVRSVAGPTGKKMQWRPPASLGVLDQYRAKGRCGLR